MATKRGSVNAAFDLQQQNLQSSIGCGLLSGAVWVWNVMDMKKNQSTDYSGENGLKMGMNRHGQVELKISF